MTDARRELQKLEVPPDVEIMFNGQVEEQQKSFRELVVGFRSSLVVCIRTACGGIKFCSTFK